MARLQMQFSFSGFNASMTMITLRKLFLKLSESPAYRRGFMAEFEYCRQFAKSMEVTRELLWGLLGGCRITRTFGTIYDETFSKARRCKMEYVRTQRRKNWVVFGKGLVFVA